MNTANPINPINHTKMKKTFLTSLFTILLLGGYVCAHAEGDASLELQTSAKQYNAGDEINVDIMLKNPGAQNVISIRSWLEYNPAVLAAENIDSSGSSFTLGAPGEDDISAGEGLVKIGRSNISGGVTESETKVATVKFKVLSQNLSDAKISFYDYQVTELGHTSVNVIEDGFPVNILAEKPKDLELTLNPGGAPASSGSDSGTQTQPVVTQPEIGGGQTVSYQLARALNLRANTGSGYVDLRWDSQSDNSRIGYNIYYGKVSGQYSRRRTIGDYDNYRLDGLENNATYYFAVTAYDISNLESDYSNEVGIIVNQPLSSTNPFTSFFENALAKIPSQPQNGPLAGWMLFSAAGLSCAVVYGRKKSKI